MSRPDNPPAFARPDGWTGNTGEWSHGQEGMSLRDYFAAHAPAMDEAWASFRRVEVPEEQEPEQELQILAEWRWAYADAMLAARGNG